MSYLERNRQRIKELRPLLEKYLEEYTPGEKRNFTIVSEPSRDQNSYMTITENETSVRMNSAYRPVEEAMRWAQQFEFINLKTVVIMFGFGNGYCIREMTKRLQDGDHIIVVEPSYDIFMHALENYELLDILSDDRISIVITEKDYTGFISTIASYVDWMNVKSEVICIHPQYEKCFIEEMKTFRERLKHFNDSTLVNRNTEVYFADHIIENILHNFRYLPGSNYLMEFTDKVPKDATAIIVAAGPSLDKNIDLLKEAKGKSVIIATDTALRYLHKKGIVADFVVTIDPQKPPEYFDDCGFDKIPLFVHSMANYKVLDKHTGKKVWIVSNPFIESFYLKKGHKITEYNSGGSVACAAFMCAIAMNFSRIVMIGQDLAYKGDVTHAGGDVCRILNEDRSITYVEGIDGNKVKTRGDWYIYLKWFEDAIERFKDKIQVIDATEGGAKIHGSEIMTLRDVIDSYCNVSVDLTTLINQMQPTFTRMDLQEFQEYLDHSVTDLEMVQKESKGILDLCREVIYELKDSAKGMKRVNQLAKQITEKNEEIAKTPIFQLIDLILRNRATSQIQDMGQMSNDHESDLQKTFKYTEQIIGASYEESKALLPQLEEAVEDYRERMERSDVE